MAKAGLTVCRSPTESLRVRGPGFSYLAGVRVGGAAIWCDAARARAVSFLSRADVPLGRARPERLIASARTVSLRRALGLPCADALVPRFGRPLSLGRARLELVPSGILPGAAQLLVELGGWRGLYAGLISTQALPGCDALQARACDELVLDAPEEGGRVDGVEALQGRGEGPLVPDDLRAVFALVGSVDPARLVLSARFARAAGLRARRRVPVGRRQHQHQKVISGQAGSGQAGALALGLGPSVEELVRFALDCGARRVHVRLHRGEPLRDAGARSLIAALTRRRIEASPIGPPEQLSLLLR